MVNKLFMCGLLDSVVLIIYWSVITRRPFNWRPTRRFPNGPEAASCTIRSPWGKKAGLGWGFLHGEVLMWEGGAGSEGPQINRFEHVQVVVTWGQTDRMTNGTLPCWQTIMEFSSFVDITVLRRGHISRCLLKEGMSANTIKQQPWKMDYIWLGL